MNGARNRKWLAAAVAAFVLAGVAWAQEKQPWSRWLVHDMKRPEPPVITPGTFSTEQEPGKPPSDAIVLFDGKSLDQWESDQGGDAPWKLEDGCMVTQRSSIHTKKKFGDMQLHVEWAEPTPAQGESQGRGNSGVFLMGVFEIQVLDSYQNKTYTDGQCAAIYGQYPPQVNVCRPPGQWQAYDIIFHPPHYRQDQPPIPAYVTVLQNGVVVQDHQQIHGPTGVGEVAKYPESMPAEGPIGLQFHGNAVRYRNLWVRPLAALAHQQETGDVSTPQGSQK